MEGSAWFTDYRTPSIKKHIENKIIAAEFIRLIFQEENENDFDISDFDNNIDLSINNALSLEGEENTDDGLMKATSDVLNNISIESYEEIGETIVETYKKLTSLMNNDPKSDVVQSEFINIKNKLLDVFTKANISDTEYLNSESRINLFILRVISTLSIERTINMFFPKRKCFRIFKVRKAGWGDYFSCCWSGLWEKRSW